MFIAPFGPLETHGARPMGAETRRPPSSTLEPGSAFSDVGLVVVGLFACFSELWAVCSGVFRLRRHLKRCCVAAAERLRGR